MVISVVILIVIFWLCRGLKNLPSLKSIHSSKDFNLMKHGKFLKRLLKIFSSLFLTGSIVLIIIMWFNIEAWWYGIPITILFSCALCCIIILIDPPFGPKCDKYRKSQFRIAVFGLIILIGGIVCITGINMGFRNYLHGGEYNVLNWLSELGGVIAIVFTALLIYEGFRKTKD